MRSRQSTYAGAAAPRASQIDRHAATFIRPSMHSDFVSRKDSAGSNSSSTGTPMVRGGRGRSLSADSDSGKHRSSVPLLYASTISSMSTLSSSFYQYDATVEMDPMLDATPSSSVGSSDRKRSSPPSDHDPPMRLPPVQERALRQDAVRMTRELLAEQLQALDILYNRSVFAAASVSLGNEVATANGVRVFEKPGRGGGGVSGRAKKNQSAKRYTAHWQVHATMDEVLGLLARDDRDVDKYASCQAALHPETVNSKLLWRPQPRGGPWYPRSRSQRSVEDPYDYPHEDHDEACVLMVETNDENELRVVSDRGGHAKYHTPKTNSRQGKGRRRGRRPAAADWLGINWWVQHMPNKLSRDRDFVVLEKQTEVEMRTTGKGPRRRRRGFVHLTHSVDLADVSTVEKRLMSPFVRGLVIHSGLVVVESDEPGVLDVATTLETDFAGHLSAGQQRQLIVKRLLQMETLSELLWKTRMLESQLLQWKPRLNDKSDGRHTKCDRCQFKVSRFSRRSLESCRACDRIVCTNCSDLREFPPALIASATPNRQLPMDVDRNGVLKARVCTHCVAEHSRPRLQRHQSNADMYDDDDDDDDGDNVEDDDDDEAYERSDVIPRVLPQYPLHSHYQAQRKQSRPASAPVPRASQWNPSRSSRVAETLVDSFLMSMSPGASVLPKAMPFSPSTLSDDMDSFNRDDQFSRPEPPAKVDQTTAYQPTKDMRPALQPNPPQPRRESRAASMRRPSIASTYTPLQGYDRIPPRKRSMFETIPEPAPRKNVVLYEG